MIDERSPGYLVQDQVQGAKLQEGFALARYEKVTGQTVSRPRGNAEQGVDAIAANGTTISVKGPLVNQNGMVEGTAAFEGLKSAIVKDLASNSGARKLVIDLMGLSQKQVGEVQNLIARTPNRYNKSIEVIR